MIKKFFFLGLFVVAFLVALPSTASAVSNAIIIKDCKPENVKYRFDYITFQDREFSINKKPGVDYNRFDMRFYGQAPLNYNTWDMWSFVNGNDKYVGSRNYGNSFQNISNYTGTNLYTPDSEFNYTYKSYIYRYINNNSQIYNSSTENIFNSFETADKTWINNNDGFTVLNYRGGSYITMPSNAKIHYISFGLSSTLTYFPASYNPKDGSYNVIGFYNSTTNEFLVFANFDERYLSPGRTVWDTYKPSVEESFDLVVSKLDTVNNSINNQTTAITNSIDNQTTAITNSIDNNTSAINTQTQKIEEIQDFLESEPSTDINLDINQNIEGVDSSSVDGTVSRIATFGRDLFSPNTSSSSVDFKIPKMHTEGSYTILTLNSNFTRDLLRNIEGDNGIIFRAIQFLWTLVGLWVFWQISSRLTISLISGSIFNEKSNPHIIEKVENTIFSIIK